MEESIQMHGPLGFCMEEESQELPPLSPMPVAKQANSSRTAKPHHKSVESTPSLLSKYKWWIQIAILTISVISGQSVGTLLGRLYFDKGGNSKWMGAFVQTAGFPILLPFLYNPQSKNHSSNNNYTRKPYFPLIITSFYALFGVFLAGISMLFSIGILYLPVSTYSLVSATQLGFNALFSYFLNSQKLTPFILNSLLLLTISSTLLVFQTESSDSDKKIPKEKYPIGFLCTVAASAGYGLMLSVTQLFFRKFLKKVTFRVVLDMTIYPAVWATCVILLGLFVSREYQTLRGEMEAYELGRLSYVMTLLWTAISWQVYAIGLVGLIFKVSSLFANVISTFALPVVPVLAVVFFHDKMYGVKVIAMVLAIWGFLSYVYQHYLDDLKTKVQAENVSEGICG